MRVHRAGAHHIAVVALIAGLSSGLQVSCNAQCGDGICSGSESVATCPEDCLEAGLGDTERGGGLGPVVEDESVAQIGVEVNPDSLILCYGGSANGNCEPGEYPWNCPADCYCGDGVCRGETCQTCPTDCNFGDPAVPCCGDQTCNWWMHEYNGNCEADCGLASACGDGRCEFHDGETCHTCPIDCLQCDECGNGLCDNYLEQTLCPDDCGLPPAHTCGMRIGSDSLCRYMVGDFCATCPQDCANYCGDGTCDGWETFANCSGDCPPSIGACGNGTCDYAPDVGMGYAEDGYNCPQDCGPPPTCGDHTCNGAENYANCSTDCPACWQCGDGVCDLLLGETCQTCPDDCNFGDLLLPCCGDGLAQAGEDITNCPADLGPAVASNIPQQPGPEMLLVLCGDRNLQAGEECEGDIHCPVGYLCSGLCQCVLASCPQGTPCYGSGPGYPCTTDQGQPGFCQLGSCDCLTLNSPPQPLPGSRNCPQDAPCYGLGPGYPCTDSGGTSGICSYGSCDCAIQEPVSPATTGGYSCPTDAPCYGMGPGYPCTDPGGQSGVCKWQSCDCFVEGAAGPNPFACPAGATCSTISQAVWYCRELGGGLFEWSEVRIYTANGEPYAEEVLSGPYTGPWQPNCPGSTSTGDDDGGGESGDNQCKCKRVCLEPCGSSEDCCTKWGYRDCNDDPCTP